jgi:rhodanese-related sulfurtransferase
MAVHRRIGLLVIGVILLVLAGIAAAGCGKNQISAQEIPARPAATQARVIKDISTQEAFSLIQENGGKADFSIIDVRTPQEFSQGHLENAVNIDYNSVSFNGTLTGMAKDKTYLIYCMGGSRSGKALAVMKEQNFMTVYNMLGGINKWVADGLPTVK